MIKENTSTLYNLTIFTISNIWQKKFSKKELILQYNWTTSVILK